MGAFGGLLTFDSRPVEREWLETLGSLLVRQSPGPQSVVLDGCFGLVHRALSAGETGRPTRPSTSDRLAFNGRVDNREELISHLDLPLGDTRPDADMVRAGLERLGERFAADIVGDYAFAYWNPRTHQLLLGRDSAGVGTIYFHVASNFVAFATDLGSLLHATGGETTFDDDYVAGFLTFGPEEHRTPYRAVHAVSPGCVLTISCNGRVLEHTAWSPSVDPAPIVYRDDREYAEHFAHLFRNAIKVRLRSRAPIVAELSGGLDSSSIVCVADDVLRTEAVECPSLTTASYVCDVSRTSNEQAYLSVVERQCGREAFHVLESRVPYFTPALHPERLYVLSILPVAAGFNTAVCAQMERLGAQTLLSGYGGDEVFYSTHMPLPGLADHWFSRDFLTLHRQLVRWSDALRVPYTRLLWQSFELGVLRRVRLRGVTSERRHATPLWLQPDLSARARAIFENHERRLRPYTLPSRRNYVAGYLAARRAVASGYAQEFHPRRVTYPCLDRRLVEFLLAVPFGQKLRIGENRSLQRRALSNVLPPEVLGRRGKATGAEVLLRILRSTAHQWDAMLDSSVAGAHGYIDGKRLLHMLQRYRRGQGPHCSLIRALALETWLRARSGSPVHDILLSTS